MIFFTDLLGMDEIYNRPGIVSEENWSLRIPGDFAGTYNSRVASNQAINIPKALAMAIRARGESLRQQHQDLLHRLDQLSGPQPENSTA